MYISGKHPDAAIMRNTDLLPALARGGSALSDMVGVRFRPSMRCVGGILERVR